MGAQVRYPGHGAVAVVHPKGQHLEQDCNGQLLNTDGNARIAAQSCQRAVVHVLITKCCGRIIGPSCGALYRGTRLEAGPVGAGQTRHGLQQALLLQRGEAPVMTL